MDIRDFDNFWVELEKEKLLGISMETLRKIIERILSEYHLKLKTIEETENKDLVATSSDRLGKDAKTLIRVEKESGGVGKDETEDFYSDMVELGAINAIYLVSSYYTKEAKEFANGLPLRLIDRKELSDLIYDVESIKFEKAFVSDINDQQATKHFRRRIKNKITNLVLGLKDKIKEIDRRYLPIGYFSITVPAGSGEEHRKAYIDLASGDLFYIDEGLLKKTEAIKKILELPAEAKKELLELVENGQLPVEHLNHKNTDILAKKGLINIHEKKRGGGIFMEIVHLIAFIVAELAEPIGIARGKYQESTITKNKYASPNIQAPPMDHPYDLEYFIETSHAKEEFDADKIKYQPAEVAELLSKFLSGTVKFNYMVYFPYYVAKYSGPQGTRYERTYSPKFKGFFPKKGSYSSMHHIIDKFPDFPYLLLAFFYMGAHIGETDLLLHTLSASLLFIAAAISIGILLKGIFRTQRTTPFYATQDYGIKWFRYGFPSLHSLASMGAVTFSYFIEPDGPLLAAIMLFISLIYIRSRTRIGAHSKTDVIGGAIIGFVLGIVLGMTILPIILPKIVELILALALVIGMLASIIARLRYIL